MRGNLINCPRPKKISQPPRTMPNPSKPTTIQTVDEYIARQPEALKEHLKKIRLILKSAAPQAEETLTYQTPAYRYTGLLVGFAAAKTHIGFYVMSEAVIKTLSSNLKGYSPAKTSIRFSYGQDLPSALIRKIVALRIKENEAKKK